MSGAATLDTHYTDHDRAPNLSSGLELFEAANIPAHIIHGNGQTSCNQQFSRVATFDQGKLSAKESDHSADLNSLIARSQAHKCALKNDSPLLLQGTSYEISVAWICEGKSLLLLKQIPLQGLEEAELYAQIAELEASRKDLEQLAYAACHDLRSPLRAMSTIPLWISGDVEENIGYLPPSIGEHIEWLLRQAARLNAMLDDLLVYAKLGSSREGSTNRPVDWQKLVQGIWDSQIASKDFQLDLQLGQPNGTFPIDEISLILRHLLRNAVIHHDREAGRIEFETQQGSDWCSLAVRDDGPGIDGELHEQALSLFGTLKSRDKVEGSGMGLPIVNKIVTSLKGKMSIGAGIDGRGTQILITLPYIRT